MFYAKVKKGKKVKVVYVIGFDGGSAVAISEDGTIALYELADLTTFGKVAPYARWPEA